jgi:hypothetical protein
MLEISSEARQKKWRNPEPPEQSCLVGLQLLLAFYLSGAAYYTGNDFKPAKRVPAAQRTYWNTGGARRLEG